MKVLELFAGAGGAALGLERAGLEHAALVEWKRTQCQTLRAAGHRCVIQADVARYTDWLHRVRGPIDLLWASPPCQPWSENGARKGVNDERNLWPATLDVIERVRPRWFIGEAVRGMAVHDLDCDFDCTKPGCRGCYLGCDILGALTGWFPHCGFFEVNCADYGVPQERRRIIVWAGPTPLTVPPKHPRGAPAVAQVLDPWRCPVCAGSRKIDRGMFPATECRHCDEDGVWLHFAGKPVSIVATGRAGGGVARAVMRPAPTIGTKGTAMFVQASPGEKMTPATPGRRLSAGEEALLMGFPDAYPWQGNDGQRREQAGNAVPPALAAAIGRHLLDADAKVR